MAKEKPRVIMMEGKSVGLTLFLSLFFGFLGLWGIGHLYVGRFKRGIILLIIGILLAVVWLPAILGGAIVGGLGGLIGMGILFFVIAFVGFIWQVYDACKLANQYNWYVQKHGKPPW